MLRPLLVTGAHRSGTTWAGRMLAASPGIAYISEPLNVLHRPGVLRATVKHWYTYVCVDNEAEYLPAFQELIEFDYHVWDEIRSLRTGRDLLRMLRDFGVFYRGSLQGQRPLLKDPFAVFSLPWFAERLHSQIVVTVRHPAAFASSLKRLNWSFDFADLLQQRLLMRDYLEPYRAQMDAVEAGDVVGQAAVLWALIYRVVHVVHDRQPAIQIALHETLSADPEEEYHKLYEALGLSFTRGARELVIKSSNDRNPAELAKGNVHSVRLDSRANLDNWKRRLSGEEITRIRKLTEDVAHFYYAEESWN